MFALITLGPRRHQTAPVLLKQGVIMEMFVDQTSSSQQTWIKLFQMPTLSSSVSTLQQNRMALARVLQRILASLRLLHDTLPR